MGFFQMSSRPIKISFTSERAQIDPESIFGNLRKRGDVVAVKMPLMGKVWLTTSHAATSAMLKQPDRFTMRKPGSGDMAALKWWMPKSIHSLANNMLVSDDPQHIRLRRLVDAPFRRAAVLKMRQRVKFLASDRAGKLARGNKPFNLVSNYSRHLPLDVIAELLGIDKGLRLQFVKYAGAMTGTRSVWGIFKLFPALTKMRKLIGHIVTDEQSAQARGLGSEGLIADLVRAEHQGDRLSHEELIAMIFLLLMAGHETTTHMISASVLALENNPEQKERFLAGENPELAVEELLRFGSTVQFSKPRLVGQSGDFFGAQLKQGDMIMAGLAAANYDPAVFEHPTQLDLSRKPNPHLEFGTGMHFCLGLQLARLEVDVALRELYAAMPELKIITREKWAASLGQRALRELMIAP